MCVCVCVCAGGWIWRVFSLCHVHCQMCSCEYPRISFHVIVTMMIVIATSNDDVDK